MEKNIAKILFVLGWVVILFGIISNVDSTFYYHATQFVAEGEKPDPLRMTQLLNDFAHPLKDGFILIGLSYIIKYLRKE
jgi:hypothetical protein